MAETTTNGNNEMIRTIVVSLASAGIVGAISIYGSTRAFEEKFASSARDIAYVQAQLEAFKADWNNRFQTQWTTVQGNSAKINEIQMNSVVAINNANDKQSEKIDRLAKTLEERGAKRDDQYQELAVAVRALTSKLDYIFPGNNPVPVQPRR